MSQRETRRILFDGAITEMTLVNEMLVAPDGRAVRPMMMPTSPS